MRKFVRALRAGWRVFYFDLRLNEACGNGGNDQCDVPGSRSIMPVQSLTDRANSPLRPIATESINWLWSGDC